MTKDDQIEYEVEHLRILASENDDVRFAHNEAVEAEITKIRENLC